MKENVSPTVLPTNWQVENGELVVRPAGRESNLNFGDFHWTDYDFSFNVCRADGNATMGCYFRRDMSGNRGHFTLGLKNNNTGGSRFGARGTAHGHPGPQIDIGHWYAVQISCRGRDSSVSLDGKKIFKPLTDEQLRNGAVGFFSTGNGTVRFKDVKVTSPDGKVLWEGLPDLDSSLQHVEADDDADQSDATAQTSGRTDDGFVSLFNGKDLSGWHETVSSGVWSVNNGILVGKGKPAYLCTDRGDYNNVHIRAKTRINRGGNSGIYARATGTVEAPGYEAEINGVRGDPLITGSVWFIGGQKAATIRPPKPDEWFTEELIVLGNDVTVFANGQETAHFVDKNTIPPGHIAVEVRDPQTTAEFESVEVKEMPVPVVELNRDNIKTESSQVSFSKAADKWDNALSAGSVWEGRRYYRKGAWEGGSVTYFLHISKRDGEKFSGHVFDNGPLKNRAEVEGEIRGSSIQWKENTGPRTVAVRGTIHDSGKKIQLTFHGTWNDRPVTSDGDGELSLDAKSVAAKTD